MRFMVPEMIEVLKKVNNFVKRSLEGLKHELRVWKLAVCGAIPGNIGIFVRNVVLVREFSACGKGIMILEGLVVDNPQGLSLGNNFACNRGCHFNAGGGISIGNDVLLGPGVKIWSVNHNFRDLEVPVFDQGYTQDKVTIEDGVWVGANVCILPGVTIGTRSVVGAATVLTKSVPPFSLVVGNPGRIIKSLRSDWEKTSDLSKR